MRHNTATIVTLGLAAALAAACSREKGVEERPSSDASSILADNGVAVPASMPVVESAQPPTPAVARGARIDGIAAYDRGEYGVAVEKLTVAVAGRPNDDYALYVLGLAQWKSGSPEEAERSLTASLGMNDQRLKGWINLARVRMERASAKDALEAARKAIAIDPSSADAIHQEGRALLALGRRDEAETALLAARGLDPDNGYVANTLGLLLIQSGKAQDAIEHLEAAKERLPHVAYVRNNLGVAYEKTGRLKDALVEYQAAVDAGDTRSGLASLARLGPVVGPAVEPTADPTVTASR